MQLDSKAEAIVANLPTPLLTPDPLSTDLAAPQTVFASQAKSPTHQEFGYKLVQGLNPEMQSWDQISWASLLRR